MMRTNERTAEPFPVTRHSVIGRLRSGDLGERQRGWDVLVAIYWRPVYSYLRLRWRYDEEAAQDATQEFFAMVYERSTLDRFDPAAARFRTYLRVCLDRLAANDLRDRQRLKRGGAVQTLSLDYAAAEAALRIAAPAESDPEIVFDRLWRRSLISLAVERLRSFCQAEGQDLAFRIFERYDLIGPAAGERLTYQQLADEHGVSVPTVTNALAAVRRHLRRIIHETLVEVTGSDDELHAESQALLGRR